MNHPGIGVHGFSKASVHTSSKTLIKARQLAFVGHKPGGAMRSFLEKFGQPAKTACGKLYLAAGRFLQNIPLSRVEGRIVRAARPRRDMDWGIGI